MSQTNLSKHGKILFYKIIQNGFLYLSPTFYKIDQFNYIKILTYFKID